MDAGTIAGVMINHRIVILSKLLLRSEEAALS
jgi:hypothetical protein